MDFSVNTTIFIHETHFGALAHAVWPRGQCAGHVSCWGKHKGVCVCVEGGGGWPLWVSTPGTCWSDMTLPW